MSILHWFTKIRFNRYSWLIERGTRYVEASFVEQLARAVKYSSLMAADQEHFVTDVFYSTGWCPRPYDLTTSMNRFMELTDYGDYWPRCLRSWEWTKKPRTVSEILQRRACPPYLSSKHVQTIVGVLINRMSLHHIDRVSQENRYFAVDRRSRVVAAFRSPDPFCIFCDQPEWCSSRPVSRTSRSQLPSSRA